MLGSQPAYRNFGCSQIRSQLCDVMHTFGYSSDLLVCRRSDHHGMVCKKVVYISRECQFAADLKMRFTHAVSCVSSEAALKSPEGEGHGRHKEAHLLSKG